MEADAFEGFGIREGTYDCDTDSEGYVEDPVDDDFHFSAGDIPKLQFRKEESKALWVEELGMAEMLEIKGKMWTTTGICRDGKIYCSMEETLYLVEIGALTVSNGDGTPLHLNDLYKRVAEGNNRHGCSWESFEVYRHLKYLGYIVGRHSVPWTLKKVKDRIDADEVVTESDVATDCQSSIENNENFITEKFGNMRFDEPRLLFEVFSPNSKFRKSAPGNPSFVLCLASGYPPSKEEVENLERRCDQHPLKFCTVEHGRVSFISFAKLELPILP